MSKQFPALIHVLREEPPGEDPFLVVHGEGVFDDVDETRPCAVYKRVAVGRVEVSRRFVPGRGKKEG